MRKSKNLIILVLPFLMCSAINKQPLNKYYLLSLGYLSEVRLENGKLIDLHTIGLIDNNSNATFVDTFIRLENDSLNKIIEANIDDQHEGLIFITIADKACDSCRLILFSGEVFSAFKNLKNPHQITKKDYTSLTNIIVQCAKKNDPKGDGMMESQIYFNSVLFLLGYNPTISLEQFHDIVKGF